MSSEKVPVQVSAREGYKVKKSRTGKAVMVFGFPMSLEEMDTVRAESSPSWPINRASCARIA